METRHVNELLKRLQFAWARKDAHAVAACFCPDGRYLSSIGPLPGDAATGREDVERLVAAMMRADFGSTAATTDLTLHQSGAVWKWRYDFPDGRTSFGCDLFRFRDGLIDTKDAYRKVLG
ncbi:MAG: nuclear transport factor 2 family protein [Parvularculaceae bacterium]